MSCDCIKIPKYKDRNRYSMRSIQMRRYYTCWCSYIQVHRLVELHHHLNASSNLARVSCFNMTIWLSTFAHSYISVRLQYDNVHHMNSVWRLHDGWVRLGSLGMRLFWCYVVRVHSWQVLHSVPEICWLAWENHITRDSLGMRPGTAIGMGYVTLDPYTLFECFLAWPSLHSFTFWKCFYYL